MVFDWQQTLVWTLAAAAVGYLAYRGWRAIAGRGGGCSACADCPGKPLAELKREKPAAPLDEAEGQGR